MHALVNLHNNPVRELSINISISEAQRGYLHGIYEIAYLGVIYTISQMHQEALGLDPQREFGTENAEHCSPYPFNPLKITGIHKAWGRCLTMPGERST